MNEKLPPKARDITPTDEELIRALRCTHDGADHVEGCFVEIPRDIQAFYELLAGICEMTEGEEKEARIEELLQLKAKIQKRFPHFGTHYSAPKGPTKNEPKERFNPFSIRIKTPDEPLLRNLSFPAEEALQTLARLAHDSSKDPSPEIFATVRITLEKEGTKEDRAVDLLARTLMQHIVTFWNSSKLKQYEISDLSGFTENGSIWLNERLASFLETELNDASYAKEIRARGQKKLTTFLAGNDKKEAEHFESLFKLWLPKFFSTGQEGVPILSENSWVEHWVPPCIFILAKTIWDKKVKPQLEREKAKPQALVFPVLREAIDVHTPGGQLRRYQGGNILVNHRGERVSELRRIEPLKVPALELNVLPQILHKGSKLLGSLNAYRLLHLEVSLGHQRALDDIKDFRALRFDGGWEGLAEAAGISKNKRDEVHAIIAAQAHLCFVSPDGTHGNLLSYEARRATGQHRGRVSIILGDSLLPDFIFSPGFFGNGRTARDARRLVPMLPLPPLIGKNNDKGAQVNLQLRLVSEMRKRAAELYQEGSILLSQHQLEEFAKDSALPLAILGKVIDRWTQDGDDGPALLKRIEGDRYTLGKAHQTAKDFIIQAGEEEVRGKEDGLKSRELDRKRTKK